MLWAFFPLEPDTSITKSQIFHPSNTEPFGTMPMVIMNKLYRGERPPFTCAGAPSALRNLVARCLAHDPSHRPLSMWDVHMELQTILQQLHEDIPPSNLAILLMQPCLSPASYELPPTPHIQLVDVDMTSNFATYIQQRVRCQSASVCISRISRVNVSSARMAAYMDMFLREMNSRSSNPMLRPANPTHAAFTAGLGKLKSLFERTCLGPSPLCNIIFAWHGTPAQHVEAVCRDGPRSFRTTDSGFFGAGSYFAVELEYATRYATMQARPLRSSFMRNSHFGSGTIAQRRVPRHLVCRERRLCICCIARPGLCCR
jgi:hypothetical protein